MKAAVVHWFKPAIVVEERPHRTPLVVEAPRRLDSPIRVLVPLHATRR